jgi:hypothetical protein
LPLLIDDDSRPYTYGPEWVLIPARDAVKKIIPALKTIVKSLTSPSTDFGADL